MTIVLRHLPPKIITLLMNSRKSQPLGSYLMLDKMSTTIGEKDILRYPHWTNTKILLSVWSILGTLPYPRPLHLQGKLKNHPKHFQGPNTLSLDNIGKGSITMI